MENKYKKTALAFISLMVAMLLGACSRQMSSIAKPNKMAYDQVLTNHNSQMKSVEPEAYLQATTPQPIAHLAPPILTPKRNNVHLHYAKRPVHLLSMLTPKKIAKAIEKQANVVKNLNANSHVSTYAGAMHTEGFLGLAVFCLIAGLVLFFLGYNALGGLLWTIGVVVLVIAIVFFILWIIGRAVSD